MPFSIKDFVNILSDSDDMVSIVFLSQDFSEEANDEASTLENISSRKVSA